MSEEKLDGFLGEMRDQMGNGMGNGQVPLNLLYKQTQLLEQAFSQMKDTKQASENQTSATVAQHSSDVIRQEM